jgi:hypothetical protein
VGLEHFKPLLRTHDLVQDLKWDRALRDRFHDSPAAVLDGYDLSADERRAIDTHDFKGLYDMGVHPYLLAQLARLLYGTAEGAGTSEAATALVRSLTGEGPLLPS